MQTALRLFASEGYHNTSISDILRESGCTRGVLYHHFSSKEELGYAAIDEAVQLLFQEGAVSHLLSNDHPIDRLCKAIDSLPMVTRLGAINASVTDVSLRMACVHEGFRQRFQEGMLAIISEVANVLRTGIAEGQIADSVDPEQLAHVYMTVAGGIQYAKLLLDERTLWQDAQRWLKEYLNSLRR
ncbi:MAG: TetR/AcrR family transcriptional regulator [Dehalococcoidia bacterium]